MILDLLVETFFKTFVILLVIGFIGWFGLQFADNDGARYVQDASENTLAIARTVPVGWLPYIATGIVIVFLGSLLHSFKRKY